MYLHRILQLETADPVYKMFSEMQSLHEAGESNWWSGVKPKLVKYNLPGLDQIKEMSKDCFARKVKLAITETAFIQLVTEVHGLKKTAKVEYESFKLQEYLTSLYPSQARVVFKWRSETLDIKSHLTYKYDDVQCRLCKNNIENPHHIINCGMEYQMDNDVDVLKIDCLDYQAVCELKQRVGRISSFLERVQSESS